MKIRRRRSALYVPASNERAVDKARTLPCDVVILDLEDAVAPEMKIAARERTVAAIAAGGFGEREIVVRVNGMDTAWGSADVAAVAAVCPDAILVPKIASRDDLRAYETILAEQSDVALWAMIETARSVLRLDEIASAASGGPLACLVVGSNDLAKETFFELDVDRQPLQAVLTQVVIAARAHGLAALDGVCNALDDEQGFARQCRQARAFGFDGKTLIHPAQIAACNAAFTPDPTAVAAARRLIEAFDAPENRDKAVLRVDGRMVERLHLVEARRTLVMAGIE